MKYENNCFRYITVGLNSEHLPKQRGKILIKKETKVKHTLPFKN